MIEGSVHSYYKHIDGLLPALKSASLTGCMQGETRSHMDSYQGLYKKSAG